MDECLIVSGEIVSLGNLETQDSVTTAGAEWDLHVETEMNGKNVLFCWLRLVTPLVLGVLTHSTL